jgi:hypothetical protein
MPLRLCSIAVDQKPEAATMGYRVVLTADKTLMSSYNSSMFVVFAACFPRVLPKWLYTRLFCPSRPHVDGIVELAPCGLRKIQALRNMQRPDDQMIRSS